MMEHYSHVLMAAKKAAAGTLGDGNGFRTDDQGKAEARTEAVAVAKLAQPPVMVEVVIPAREHFSLNLAIHGENSRTGISNLIPLPMRYNTPVR